ncbi:MAG: hypothetical protein M3161_02795 [Actinomycetota bacterium]|nr:hypothetical protein [Actinomycetota bacterium]
MVTDQLTALASEHRRDLLAEADRRRQLPARTRRSFRVRGRVGRRLVHLGVLISGECVDTLVRSSFAGRRPT